MFNATEEREVSDLSFETLITANKDKYESKWVPTAVDYYKAAFSYIDHTIPNSRVFLTS